MCEFLLVPQNVTFCGTCTTSEPESREPELSTAVFTLAVCTHTVCVHTVQTYCLIDLDSARRSHTRAQTAAGKARRISNLS